MSTHRYVWIGVRSDRLGRMLPAGVTADPGPPSPQPEIDVDLSDDSAKTDLDEAMANFGWEFLETLP